MAEWEYAPLPDDGSPPHASQHIKAGPKLTTSINFGANTVYISGGHTSSFSGASFKFTRTLEHPLIQNCGDFVNYRVYSPTNIKKMRVMIFRQIPRCIKIFHIVAASRDLARVHNALSGDHILDVPMEQEWTMAHFKNQIKVAMIERGMFSNQQRINLDVEHVGGMKVKNFLKDEEGPAKKRKR